MPRPEDLPEPLREALSDPRLRKMVTDPSFREFVAMHILGAPTPDLAPPGKYDDWQMVRLKGPPEVSAENRRMQAQTAMSHRRPDIAIDNTCEGRWKPCPRTRRRTSSWARRSGRPATSKADSPSVGWRCRSDPSGNCPRSRSASSSSTPSGTPKRVRTLRRFSEAKEPSTHLKFNLATARWRCGDFDGGLALFEDVLRDKSYKSYPNALNQAAHCAFMVGEDVRGRRYAKATTTSGSRRHSGGGSVASIALRPRDARSGARARCPTSTIERRLLGLSRTQRGQDGR